MTNVGMHRGILSLSTFPYFSRRCWCFQETIYLLDHGLKQSYFIYIVSNLLNVLPNTFSVSLHS